MMAKRLSERQKNVYNFIQTHTQRHGYPPTVREIGEAIGVKSTSLVTYYLKQLEERGLITREASKSRAILLTQERKLSDTIPVNIEDQNVLSVPFLGYIAAGLPINVDALPESELDTIQINRALFKREYSDLYALEVQGNSMIDALINDGDMVILQHQQTIDNGQMAAVWLKSREETTLKKVYREGKQIRLQPANPSMAPIYVPSNDVEIQGKVVLVIRRLG
ncbi:MAG: transcriptional repressor LexA [Anaerolineae bacterium]|nr:transcriptional repressor LexA [Anaerolineae bacterium]